MSAIASIFGGALRMLFIGWGMEAINPFQKDTIGRLVKSSNPADEKVTQGESISDPIDAMIGLSKLDKRAQAAMIRRDVEAALSREAYAVLELRLCAVTGHSTAVRKFRAIKTVAGQIGMAKTYPIRYIELVCAVWGGQKVQAMDLVIHTASDKAPEGSRSTENRWRKDLLDYLDVLFDDVIDVAKRRL